MNDVIFLMGPTASGKTGIAIELAQRYPIDLISVDSAMIYRGMDIGTAKPDSDELQRAPHALIDILDPTETWSAGDFCREAQQLINQSHQKDRIPLLVGGTMLYFKTLLAGLASGLPADSGDLRQTLNRTHREIGLQPLTEELVKLDPAAASRIDINNPQRVIRALEVFKLTGKSITWFWDQQITEEPKWNITQLALVPDNRALLHERIKHRFKQMLDQGFEQEVINLKARPELRSDMTAIRCVGYRQMWAYLDGEINYRQMTEQAEAATRQLAKRQLTWLRSWDKLTRLTGNSEQNLNDTLAILGF